MTDNNYTRTDGVLLPQQLIADMLFVMNADNIRVDLDSALMKWVKLLPYARLPITHPLAYPRYTPEIAERWEKERGKRAGHYAVSQAVIDWEQKRFDNMRALMCPNCLGEKGKGRFYAPTETERSAHLYRPDDDFAPKRGLREYACPVCAGNDFAAYCVRVCGITSQAALLRSDRDMWWRFEGRIAIEEVVRQFVSQSTLGERGGLYTIVGPYGCGKTVLMEWATLKLARAGIRAQYITMLDLSTLIMDGLDEGDFGTPSIIEKLMEVPYLVIDQFEKVKEENARGKGTYVAEWVMKLMHSRERRQDSQGTLVAINREKWEERGSIVLGDTFDRLRGGTWAESKLVGVRDSLGTQIKEDELGDD